MAHINTRLLDAAEERLNALAPLRGYAAEQLVSLQEAVVKLRKLIDDVDSRVWTATNRSENPTDTLSQEESAAIVLYTMEWDPHHPSLYLVLNQTLRLEDRRKLTPWFPYLKLFFTGLFKLPPMRCTVWRGVRGDLRSQYKQDKKVTWWAFSSCTTAINVLQREQYLGMSGPRTLFAIDCLNGKNIKQHSYFAQEEEVLLLPCTHLQVISHLSSMDDLHIIHLREIPPPFVLLEPPSSMSTGSTVDELSYDQLKSKLEQLTNENKGLKIQCDQQQVQIKKQKIKIDEQQLKINELQNENEILHKNYASYEEQIQRLEKDNRRLKQEVQQCNQELERQNEENQGFKHDNRHLKQEAQQHDKQIEHPNEKIKRLNPDIQRLQRPSTSSTNLTSIPSVVSSKQESYSLASPIERSNASIMTSRNTMGE